MASAMPCFLALAAMNGSSPFTSYLAPVGSTRKLADPATIQPAR